MKSKQREVGDGEKWVCFYARVGACPSRSDCVAASPHARGAHGHGECIYYDATCIPEGELRHALAVVHDALQARYGRCGQEPTQEQAQAQAGEQESAHGGRQCIARPENNT